MRHIYIIGVAVALLFSSCSKEEPVPTKVIVGDAGKAYYETLIAGEIEGFVDGIDGAQDAPASYRELLVENTRQFVHKQDSLHRGLQAVAVDSTAVFEADSTARVFLHLTFGDGGRERVLLPMVCRQGRWLMR